MTLLASIVATSRQVGATAARSGKVRLLSECLRALGEEELEIGVLYLSGEIRQGRIGIGPSTLRANVRAVAATPALALLEVDRLLDELSTLRGSGSTAKRAAFLSDLFGRATRDEQEFLLRLLIGELRQGALAGVMIEALSAALAVPLAELRRAAMYQNNLGALARAGLGGVEALRQFRLEVMSPVAPMLAQTAEDVDEALETLAGDIAFEWKIDGARIQVHKRDDDVRIFTRNLNDVTAAIPEIAEAARALPARQLVLDGEAIAFTPGGRPHAFQMTMRRFGRKLDVERLRAELPMRAYYFDCLRRDETSLAELPARERFAALAAVVPEAQAIPRLVTRDSAAATAFYDAALAAGHEGLMAKTLDSPYEAGNRGASWLKIKRTHTLDLVVLAAEWGHGRRHGKLSNLHLGALDSASGQYVMLGKTFKGLTDAMLEWQTREFLARESRRDEYTVFIRPEIVVEIAFSDLQSSARYPGGLALRLARVKRYRPDKKVEEADTMESVRRIFAAQSADQAAAG